MTPEFQERMAKATELTRSGRLQEAAALIQAALAGAGGVSRSDPDDRAGQATRPLDPADVTDLPWRAVPAQTTPDPAGAGPAPADTVASPRPETPPPADPGRIVRAAFSEPTAGTRQYRLYLPPQAVGRRAPLVVMLHGCNQDPDDFARGTRMDEAARREGFAVLYPGQSSAANPQRCWNWFRASDQGRDHGEAALLAAMIRQIIGEHDLDADRVFVAGLSAGGAMAAVLGRSYPRLFAAVGVHSGLAPGSATDLPSAFLAMRGLDATGLPGGLGGAVAGAGALAGTPLGSDFPRINPMGINPMGINPMEINPAGTGVGATAPRNIEANARASTCAGDRTEARHPTIPTIVFHGSADPIVHPRNGDQVLAQATPEGGRVDSDSPQAAGPAGAAAWPGRRPVTRSLVRDRHGVVVAEHWVIHGAAHAWSGGSLTGSFTDPSGPDATAEMVRFFLARKRGQAD